MPPICSNLKLGHNSVLRDLISDWRLQSSTKIILSCRDRVPQTMVSPQKQPLLCSVTVIPATHLQYHYWSNKFYNTTSDLFTSTKRVSMAMLTRLGWLDYRLPVLLLPRCPNVTKHRIKFHRWNSLFDAQRKRLSGYTYSCELRHAPGGFLVLPSGYPTTNARFSYAAQPYVD